MEPPRGPIAGEDDSFLFLVFHSFDRQKIKAAGYSDTVAVLLTNSDDLESVECGAKE